MTAPRAFLVLLRHDITMMLRSAYLMYLLIPLIAGLLFRTLVAGGDDDRLGVAFTLLLAVLFAIAMAGTLPGLYLLVEERERGSCRTLARTGVSPAMVMCSKFAAGVVWSMALSAIALAVLSPFDATCTVMLWLSCLPAAVAIAGAATAFGGVIASQSDTSTPSLVIVTLLMFGMLAPMDYSLRMVSEFLPANLYMDTVMAMATGQSPLMGWLPVAAIGLIWLMASLMLFRWSLRRFRAAARSVVPGESPEQQPERHGADDDPDHGHRNRR